MERGGRYLEVFASFLRLGFTSFGGPIAHLGYFHDEFVLRRKWLDEAAFGQIVALCQLLPGPASSQVGIIIGLSRAGFVGAVLAWCAFTLPSAIALTVFAFFVSRVPTLATSGAIHGLLVAAVAVVAFAIVNMFRSLCPDLPRRLAAFATAVLVLTLPVSPFVQVVTIAAGGVFGLFFVPRTAAETQRLPITGDKRFAVAAGVAFLLLLVGFPFAHGLARNSVFDVFGAFYESGALVFGGGHVVLPLLEARVVPPGWISPTAFLAGYGAAQAVPGPLFTFSAYLGAAMNGALSGLAGAGLALFAIYLPSFLLLAAVLPFWSDLVRNEKVTAALRGVNAIVVGLLMAALCQPVWVNAIHRPSDVALALVAFILLAALKTPPWLIVVLSAAAAQALTML